MASLTWSATESEAVEPYATSTTALEESAFRLSEKEDFRVSDVWLLENEQEWCEARPEILLSVDHLVLALESGIPSSDLSVHLIIRDRELNHFKLIDSWPFPDLPRKPIRLADSLAEFSRSGRIDFSIYVTPQVFQLRGEGIAARPDEVVARKCFKVRLQAKRTNFPKVWKSPIDFESEGLPRDTIFWVEWLGEDLDRHPKETFLVWLNEHHREQILSFEFGATSGETLSLNLSAMILAEIAAAVLASEQEPQEPTGTIQTIAEVLASINGLDLSEMRLRFEGHGGYSLVRAWSQEKVGLHQQFQSLSFVGAA